MYKKKKIAFSLLESTSPSSLYIFVSAVEKLYTREITGQKGFYYRVQKIFFEI